MKKIFLFLAVAGATIFSSCEGPEGPAGFSAEAIVYEIPNVNFLPNSFGIIYTFPQQALASDHVLVYRLSASTTNGGDVWQLIPQSYYFDDGTFDFKYDYDHTFYDVNIFLEGFDLQTLSAAYTQNQIFRVVVIPGQFGNKSAVNTKSYDAVAAAYNIQEKDVKRGQVAKNK